MTNNNHMLNVISSNIKKLIISRGPSGSGKSRMAKELSEQHGNAPIFSSDDFFMKDNIYEFDIKPVYKQVFDRYILKTNPFFTEMIS